MMETPKLRLIFMGSSDFAVPALRALLSQDQQFDVSCVFSQPARASGRGQKLTQTPVAECALEHDLPLLTPTSLKSDQQQQFIKDQAPDFLIVVAYGLLLPQSIIDCAKFGAINIHGSLLPRWRGAAPIQRAIEAGDKDTGVTLIQMDKGLDTGEMLQKAVIPIQNTDTSLTLGVKLAELGSELLPQCLMDHVAGKITPIAQAHDQASYAHKLHKSEALIDFKETANQYDQRFRAFTPWPLLSFDYQQERIKIKALSLAPYASYEAQMKAGQVISLDPLTIKCSKGALILDMLQRPSKSPQTGASLAQALGLKQGDIVPNN
ncbi:MAG: methionyl-tRNA formyltransferase [Alphaproteobacteria bacterium]